MGKAYGDLSKTVLEPKQAKRVDEITLQARFPFSYMILRVVTALKLTDDQVKKILAVITDYNTAIFEWAKDTTDVGAPKRVEDQIRIIKTTSGKFNDILTKDQRAAWKEMIGTELPLEKILGGAPLLNGSLPPLPPTPIVVVPPPTVELPPPPRPPLPPLNGKQLQ